MNFPWSNSAPARDRATADAASLSSKMTTATNPSVSQQQLGNGTAALVQQRALVLPQERALAACVSVREDAGALLLLQQQHQQVQSARHA
jgi:hypothetical protein